MFQQFLSRSTCVPSSRNSFYKVKSKVSQNTFLLSKSVQKSTPQKTKTHKIAVSELHNNSILTRPPLRQKNFNIVINTHPVKTNDLKQTKKLKVSKKQCQCKCLEQYDQKIKSKQKQLKYVEAQLSAQMQTLRIAELRNERLQQHYGIRYKQLEQGKHRLEQLTSQIQSKFKQTEEQNNILTINILKQKEMILKRKRHLDEKQIYLEALRKNLKKYEVEIRKALKDLRQNKLNFDIESNFNSRFESLSSTRNQEVLNKLLFDQEINDKQSLLI